jgi:hypothetical protein
VDEQLNAIEDVADDIAAMVNGGYTVEAAERRLARWMPPDVVSAARLLYERRVGIIRDLEDPGALVDDDIRLGYWYQGPRHDDIYWPALRRELIEDGLGEGINSVHDSSNKVVGLLRPPGAPEVHSRGLVLGYIQSGKTTNYMSVVAKAADVGYRLFVVLSGVTDNLRSQTQARLEEKLVGDIAERWFLLTSMTEDFLSPGNAPNLLSRSDHRLLAVIKKNPYRIRRLVRWLESAGQQVLEGCPILLIDDEADQASINVGSRGRTSRINGLIQQILIKPKAAYVAYTATPFANLLIDPSNFEDIYPRDFVVELPKSDQYFGPEKLFGRERLTSTEDESVTDGLDVIRHVPEEEVGTLRAPRTRAEVDDWQPQITESLAEALEWFVLATAARRFRGTGVRHSTMLVHTTMLASAHLKMKPVIENYLSVLARQWREDDLETTDRLQRLWRDESKRFPALDAGEASVAWGDLSPFLGVVLSDARVIVDNYMSSERLQYEKSGPPVTAVVIGGNTLSRGLTLEGLVCSFFIRSVSAYDTLLQMGRWFGYRSGYADLHRLWMTEELESWFFDLATVEEEIRREIRRYEQENIRPIDLPVRIRRHPALAITSAAKMRGAIPARISFSQAREQTILFNHRDADWLNRNIEATRRLFAKLRSVHDLNDRTADGRPIVRGVPVEHVREFLTDYQFHDRAFRMRADLLLGYIDEQNQQGYLSRWNIVVMSHPTEDNGVLDVGLDREVPLIERNRLDMPSIGYANIKSLVSTVDRVADMDIPRAQLAQLLGRNPDDKRLAGYREDVLGDVGLLCIYPISKNSQPRDQRRLSKPGTRRRLPLNAVEDVIGVGLFFPEARGKVQEYTYMSADLSRVPREADVEVIDEVDAADELAGESAAQNLDARTAMHPLWRDQPRPLTDDERSRWIAAKRQLNEDQSEQ